MEIFVIDRMNEIEKETKKKKNNSHKDKTRWTEEGTKVQEVNVDCD